MKIRGHSFLEPEPQTLTSWHASANSSVRYSGFVLRFSLKIEDTGVGLALAVKRKNASGYCGLSRLLKKFPAEIAA